MAKQNIMDSHSDDFELDPKDFIEKTPDALADPTLKKLAGETAHEGGTLAKLAQQDNSAGFTPSFLEPKPRINEPTKVSIGPQNQQNTSGKIDDTASASKLFGNGAMPGPPPGAGATPSSNGMPPKVDMNNYANIPFLNEGKDDDGDDSGKGPSSSGGGLNIPNEIVDENADKIASQFVEYEEMIFTGFLKQYSKINTQKIKRALTINDIDPRFSDKLLFVVDAYNRDVDNTFVFTKQEKKLLREAWKDVLMQYTEISDNVTPELRLIMAHIPIAIKFWMSMKEFKETKAVNEKMISDTLADIREEMRKQYGNIRTADVYNSSGTNTESKRA